MTPARGKRWEIDVSEDALGRYITIADSEEEARAKLAAGVWDSWQDLGTPGDTQVIVDVREHQQ